MFENSNDRVGQKVSNYRLVRLIGCGGFADVYLGEHIYLKTQAAVKVLHVRTNAADQPDILNEARTIAQLEHPHIIRLFEFGIDDGYPFLIMNYAARGSLRDLHPKGSRLPAALVMHYVQQVASALDYAHQNRLIHRDVKPENMLVGQNEQVLLTDFGLVMMAQTSRSQASDDLAGTVAYMAPEQLRGRPRFASDQYALGVVAYEWLCGRRPFTGSFGEIASQQMLESPPSLCRLEPGLAPEVEQAVFKALAKNPADRFVSAGEFARALNMAYANPGEFRLNFPQKTSINNQSSDPVASYVDGSVATLISHQSDSGETVEIDKAATLAYDANEELNTIQILSPRQSGQQILSMEGETITPDPVVQAFQLSPVVDAARVLPARRNKDPKSMFLLFALLLFVAGSVTMGLSQFGPRQPIRPITVRPGKTRPSLRTATRTIDMGTSTAGAITATGTAALPTTSSAPAPNPIATEPPPTSGTFPVLTLTSVPPTRIPTPAPPRPTPIQSTPAPIPTPNPIPKPTQETLPTPDASMTIPTPDANMLPGLIQ